MSRRSKREMAPPPQIFSPSVPMMPAARPREMAPPPQISSPSASDFLSGPGCFPTPPASINTTMGSAAPSPWWCGPPVPQQGMSWWPAPSCGGGATASSSQSVQKDDIDSDPKEWGVDNGPPGGFLSYFNHPWSQSLPQPTPPHLFDGNRGKGSPTVLASESHQLIVEDEKEMVKFPIDLNEQGGSSIALPPEVQRGGGPIFSEILRRRAEIHHQPTHKQLKKDLIEHIWQKFANRRNN